MILSDGNISLEKYFENEIKHINEKLEQIIKAISERNLRVFQLEEIHRDLDVRVHDLEAALKLIRWLVGVLVTISISIAIAWLLRVLGL